MNAPESPIPILKIIDKVPTRPPKNGDTVKPAIIVARLAVSIPRPGGPDLAIHFDIRISTNRRTKIKFAVMSSRNKPVNKVIPTKI